MKLLTVLFGLLISFESFGAERVCRPKRGYEGHRSFCEALSPFACRAHDNICRSIIIPDEDGSCTSRRGYEGHESFCASLNEFSCEVHSICRWIEGWG